MKILYGVQGTGNGHISRANAISDQLSRHPDVKIDWLLSGREANDLFQVQGGRLFRRGLTFAASNGRIGYFRTLINNNLMILARDIKQLNLDSYDYIVTDYEPVVSWAAKVRSRTLVGIGHQYAFQYDVPLRGDNPLNRMLLRRFAPADVALGLHWHHFDRPILPPICDLPNWNKNLQQPEKVVVYLPFEDQERVMQILRPLSNYQFVVYSPEFENASMGHIQTRALSRQGFKQDLITSNAVIANTGFELISECLCMGIKVLTKPVYGQVEQLSNGAALSKLGYAQVVDQIDTATCRSWLESGESVRITYPAVQTKIADWIANAQNQPLEYLAEELWKDVHIERDHQSVPTVAAVA